MITYRVQIYYQRTGMTPQLGQQALDEMHTKASAQATTGINWGKLETGFTVNKDPLPEWLSEVLKQSGFYFDSFNLFYYKDHKHEGQAEETRLWFEDKIRPWALKAKKETEKEMKKVFSRLMVPHNELKERDAW